MLCYSLNCKKNTEFKNSKFVRTENGRIMLSPKCAVCNNKKKKFIKDQEARRLLSNLIEEKVPILSNIPIVNILF